MKRSFTRWHAAGLWAVALASTSAFGVETDSKATKATIPSVSAIGDPLNEAIEAERGLVERLARLEEHRLRAVSDRDEKAMRELEETVSALRFTHLERMQRLRLSMSPQDRERLERHLIEQREVRMSRKAAAAAERRERGESRMLDARNDRKEARMERRHDRQETTMEARHDWRKAVVGRKHDRQETRVAERAGDEAAQKIDARHDKQEARIDERQDKQEANQAQRHNDQEARQEQRHDGKETRTDKKPSTSQKKSDGKRD